MTDYSVLTGKGKNIAGVSSQFYYRSFTIAVLSSQLYHRSFVIAIISLHGNLTLLSFVRLGYVDVIYTFNYTCIYLYLYLYLHILIYI